MRDSLVSWQSLVLVLLLVKVSITWSTFSVIDYQTNEDLRGKHLLVDPPDFRVSIACEESQIHQLASTFAKQLQENKMGLQCSPEEWLPMMSAHDIPGPKLFVSLGIERGYHIANWMHAFNTWNGVTASKWHELYYINHPDIEYACGFCNECETSQLHIDLQEAQKRYSHAIVTCLAFTFCTQNCVDLMALSYDMHCYTAICSNCVRFDAFRCSTVRCLRGRC